MRTRERRSRRRAAGRADRAASVPPGAGACAAAPAGSAPKRPPFRPAPRGTPPRAIQPTLISAPSAEPSRSNERHCRTSAPGVSGSMLMSDIASRSRLIAKWPSGPTGLISMAGAAAGPAPDHRRKTASGPPRERPARPAAEAEKSRTGPERTGEPVRPCRAPTAAACRRPPAEPAAIMPACLLRRKRREDVPGASPLR